MDWLLLRGLSREQRHWGAFPEIFRAALPNDTRIHFLDLPGTGTEVQRPSPTTVRDIMEDLRARWIALQAANPGPWGLLAMSLGGMVAMAWCDHHPEDFARLVLSNTSASNIGKPWDRMSPSALTTVVRAAIADDPIERERLVLSMVTRRRDDLDILARQWADIHASSPVTRTTVARQLGAATAYRAPDRLSVPVLIIAAARDALANPACGRALAERFGAPLELHPGGGHELALDAPDWMAERIASWIERPPSVAVSSGVRLGSLGKGRLPLVIEPGHDKGTRSQDISVRTLESWISSHRSFVNDKIVEHGAILARGFDVLGPADFDRVARAVEPSLLEDLGDKLFSAVEPKAQIPVPPHIETSFAKAPPRRVFLACITPPEGDGGETPIVDFRAVFRDLDPIVKDRFARLGVRHTLRYDGPESGRRLGLWKLPRWDEAFGTSDRSTVDRMCQSRGLTAEWRAGGRLEITAIGPAVRPHPVTGDPVWHNHAHMLHVSTLPSEYRRIAARTREISHAGLSIVTDTAVRFEAGLRGAGERAAECSHADGSPISEEDMEAVRDAIWANTVFFRWRKGDVLILDNEAVGYGRMPFRGARQVLMRWA